MAARLRNIYTAPMLPPHIARERAAYEQRGPIYTGPAILPALTLGQVLELDDIRAHLTAAGATTNPQRVGNGPASRGAYRLPVPLEVTESKPHGYLGGCQDHGRYMLCTSASSARLWAQNAFHWCPGCNGWGDE